MKFVRERHLMPRILSTTMMLCAITLKEKSLYFCSYDFGTCREYRITDNNIGELIANQRLDGRGMDESALGSFVRTGGEKNDRTAAPEWTWHATLKVGTRIDIINHYKGLHPERLEDLRRWLAQDLKDGRNYRSITIACFTPSDPTVFVYGDRASLGPIVFEVRRDEERRWSVATVHMLQNSPRSDFDNYGENPLFAPRTVDCLAV